MVQTPAKRTEMHIAMVAEAVEAGQEQLSRPGVSVSALLMLGLSGLCVFSWSKMEMESVLKNPYKSNFLKKNAKKNTQKAQKMPPLPW